MSMLSSMTDRLRTTASEVKHVKDNNADWLWRDRITLMDAVRELRDAADTIDNLRGMCQDVQFENEKLREQCNRLLDKTLELGTENAKLRERVSELEELTDHRHYIPQEWYATLQVENAKLKALVLDMYAYIEYIEDAIGVRSDCTGCPLDGKAAYDFETRMCDLGIEVQP